MASNFGPRSVVRLRPHESVSRVHKHRKIATELKREHQVTISVTGVLFAITVSNPLTLANSAPSTLLNLADSGLEPTPLGAPSVAGLAIRQNMGYWRKSLLRIVFFPHVLRPMDSDVLNVDIQASDAMTHAVGYTPHQRHRLLIIEIDQKPYVQLVANNYLTFTAFNQLYSWSARSASPARIDSFWNQVVNQAIVPGFKILVDKTFEFQQQEGVARPKLAQVRLPTTYFEHERQESFVPPPAAATSMPPRTGKRWLYYHVVDTMSEVAISAVVPVNQFENTPGDAVPSHIHRRWITLSGAASSIQMRTTIINDYKSAPTA